MKRMKRWMAIIMACALWGGMAWGAPAASASAADEFFRLSAAEGGVWCAEGSALKWIPEGETKGETVFTGTAAIEGIAAIDEGVCLLLSNEQGAFVYYFSPEDGELTERFAVEPGDVRALVASQRGVGVLYAPTLEQQDHLNFEGDFVYYDWDGKILDCPVNRALTVNAVDGAVYWVGVGRDGDYCLNRLDTETMQTVVMHEEPMLAGVPLSDGGCFYATDTGIYLMDDMGYSTQLESTSASVFVPPQMALSGRWVYLADGQGIKAFDLETMGDLDQIAQERLTIVNCMGIEDYRMYAAIAQFEARTGVHVVMTELNRQQMLTQLMAKEEDVDVLFVDGMSLSAYQRAGVLQPLSGYAALSGALESWMDVLAPASVDGELYCVPAYIGATQINVEPALLPYWDGELPETCTWSELFARARDFQMDTDGDGRPDACYLKENLYYPEFTRQYVSAHAGAEIDFSDPAFTALLAQYKQVVQAGYVRDEFGEGDERLPLLASGRMLGPHTELFLPTPTLEDGEAYEVGYVHGMAISAFSKRKELAAEFLALYAAEENQIDPEGFGFLKDIDLNPAAANLTESERAQLEKSVRQFESVAPLWQNDAFTEVLWEGMRAYIADEIEIEELVERLNQRMRMVIYG